MPKRFDSQLALLKEHILSMGNTAVSMIRQTNQALLAWRHEIFAPVAEAEESMDEFQRSIDEETVRLIAVYTPVARDLRFLLMAIRITVELERIGDHCMNICFYAKQMMKEKPLKPLIDLPRMAEYGQTMLRTALEAFSTQSSELAMNVIKTDDRVDQLNDQIFRELMTFVMADPKTITQAMELILTARAFERIADHTVSIAESVFYLVEGEDIRHVDDLPEEKGEPLPPDPNGAAGAAGAAPAGAGPGPEEEPGAGDEDGTS